MSDENVCPHCDESVFGSYGKPECSALHIFERKTAMNWDTWVNEITRVAKEKFGFTDKGITNTDWAAFKPYFNDGLSPEEALREDFSNAQ